MQFLAVPVVRSVDGGRTVTAACAADARSGSGRLAVPSLRVRKLAVFSSMSVRSGAVHVAAGLVLTVQLIQAAVVLLVTLIGGGIGWDQVKRHGAETERRKQAERERDAALVKLDRAKAAPASPAEVVGVLRRLRDRHDRMRGKAGRH